MNKQGKNPTLTSIMISAIVGLTVLTLLFTSYNQFMTDNNSTIDPNYTEYYDNLTKQSESLTGLGEDISESGGILGDILGFSSLVVNVFIIGLNSIGKFFSMIPYLNNVFQIMGEAIPGFEVLIGLATLIITLYIAMRYIQSARGNTQIS